MHEARVILSACESLMELLLEEAIIRQRLVGASDSAILRLGSLSMSGGLRKGEIEKARKPPTKVICVLGEELLLLSESDQEKLRWEIS